jgi:hypothetical protein
MNALIAIIGIMMALPVVTLAVVLLFNFVNAIIGV